MTRVILSGDTLLTRPVASAARERGQSLYDLLGTAEVVVTNFESCCPGAHPSPATTHAGSPVAVDPAIIDDLLELGFSAVGVANNHAVDYGPAGLANTLLELKTRRMLFAGAGASLRDARRACFVEARGARIAVISVSSSNARLGLAADALGPDVGRTGINPLRYTTEHVLPSNDFYELKRIAESLRLPQPTVGTDGTRISLPRPEHGIYWRRVSSDRLYLGPLTFRVGDSARVESSPLAEDVDAICSAIEAALKEADALVVSIHAHEGANGAWNGSKPAQFIGAASRAFIDAGAAAVAGHGPHELRGVEVYRGSPIAYSLGNLFFAFETPRHLPAEFSEHVGALPWEWPVAVRERLYHDESTGEPHGLIARGAYWEGALLTLEFDGQNLRTAELVPVELGFGCDRLRRGFPALAAGEHGDRILGTVRQLSEEFGASIRVSNTPEGTATGTIDGVGRR